MAVSQTLGKNMEKKEQADSKKEIRSRYLKLRDQIPEDVRREKSELITKRLMDHPWYHEAEKLLCFVSFRSEVDTLSLMRESLQAGKKVYCPKVGTDERSMEFYRIDSAEELQRGYQGILEPPADEARRFEPGHAERKQSETGMQECRVLMILPGAAFDLQCHRIGYGGGFYDRYQERFLVPVHTVAIAFDEQIASEIPSELHDICPGLVITDRQVIKRKVERCRIM